MTPQTETAKIRIVFCGHTAAHCNDVSCLKGLQKQGDLEITVLDPSRFTVSGHSLLARILRRVTHRTGAFLLRRAVRRLGRTADIVLTFKGNGINADTLEGLQAQGVKCVNFFPDAHPHAHGKMLSAAIGTYDLVISAKADHPARWQGEFGFANRCVHVPHGYDPDLHLHSKLSLTQDQTVDVAMVATARDEYFALLRDMLAAAPELANRSFLIGGAGWGKYIAKLPKTWNFVGPQLGEDYTNSLRSAAIVIAPVQREITIGGKVVPCDSDTARTYELAAMGVFFVHRYSDLMPHVFDPETEVPLFRNGPELAEHIERYLDQPKQRQEMVRNLRARAVPAYSWDMRAVEVAQHFRSLMAQSDQAVTPTGKPTT